MADWVAKEAAHLDKSSQLLEDPKLLLTCDRPKKPPQYTSEENQWDQNEDAHKGSGIW